MDAFTELDILEHHIQLAIPQAAMKLLNLPLQPPEHTFWIDIVDEGDVTPGRGISVIQRDWKMAYYNEQKTEVLRALGKLRELFSDNIKLGFQIGDRIHYVTIVSFSSGSIHQAENDQFFSFSILRTTSHGSRSIEEWEKMKDIVIIANPQPPAQPGENEGQPAPIPFPMPLPCRPLNTLRGGIIFSAQIPLYNATYQEVGPHLMAGDTSL